jgi:hypothetical protein
MDFDGTLLVHCHDECHANTVPHELEQLIIASMIYNSDNVAFPTRGLYISVHDDSPNKDPTQTHWTNTTFKHPFHLSENSRKPYFATLHITTAHYSPPAHDLYVQQSIFSPFPA